MSSNNYNNDNTFMKPAWFNKMTLKEQHKEYNVYRYINLKIYTTSDNKFFNATKLTNKLTEKKRADGKKSHSNSFGKILEGKKWSILKKKYPELFKEIKGTSTQKYKGVYIQWVLFSTLLSTISPDADINFELGEPIIKDECNKGFIYCCVPVGCDTDNIIKFGRTWNWTQRVNTYGLNTELDYLIPVDDMYLEEEKMIKYMKSFLTQSDKGDEYFIITDDDEYVKIYDYFENIKKQYNVKDMTDEWDKIKNEMKAFIA